MNTTRTNKIIACIVSTFLSFGCCLISPIANEGSSDIIYHYDLPEVSDNEVKEQVKEVIKDKYNLESVENINVYSERDLVESKKIMPRGSTLIGTTYKYEANIGWARNQPVNGVSFSNGGYIYWQDGNSIDTDISFSLGGSIFSVGVSAGVRAGGVTGYSAWCPANTRCKLKVFKDLKIQRWYVETNLGAGSIYRDYVNTTVTLGIDFTTNI